jgi:hypothetical protein
MWVPSDSHIFNSTFHVYLPVLEHTHITEQLKKKRGNVLNCPL